MAINLIQLSYNASERLWSLSNLVRNHVNTAKIHVNQLNHHATMDVVENDTLNNLFSLFFILNWLVWNVGKIPTKPNILENFKSFDYLLNLTYE